MLAVVLDALPDYLDVELLSSSSIVSCCLCN